MATRPRSQLQARRKSTVDPRDEPSAEWGWHGEFPRVTRFLGWTTAILMFVMLIGNHTGWNEDAWLIIIGVGMIGMLIRDKVKRRTAWRG